MNYYNILNRKLVNGGNSIIGVKQMISKEIIEYIIDSFKATKKNKQINRNKFASDFNLSDLVMSDERKSLKNYISELNREELYDLVGLMSFGREVYQHDNNIEGIGCFDDYRNDVEETFKEQEPVHIANYLLGKEPLDKYLQCACKAVYE